MNSEILIAFTLASMVLCFSPGPTVFLVMGQALTHGKKSTLPLVLGVVGGDLVSLSLTFIGLGALLSSSALLFNALKWLGALYLIYLGIKTFRTQAQEQHALEIKRGSIFLNVMIVTALNPKGIVFFTAFFPLFIQPQQPITNQMIILGGIFTLVSVVSVSFYATFSGLLRSKISSATFQNRFNKVSGGLLVSAGALTAPCKEITKPGPAQLQPKNHPRF